MSNTNYTGSVGQYKQVSDTVSDLNIMIVEAPVDNKFKRRLADIVYDIEREETLKGIYQFLTEITNGMYHKEGTGMSSQNAEVVQDAHKYRNKLEYHFAQEISPVESD